MKRSIPLSLLPLSSALLLTQCDTLKQDCEAVVERDKKILQEPSGDYYIGRRYYMPETRFWGFLRRPNQSWKSAKLVIMDEKLTRTPDRGPEKPRRGATFGTDNNVEYIVYGNYESESTYEPNSNQILPTFLARGFKIRDLNPGFLFTPSEEYHTRAVSLYPALSPSPEDYQRAGVAPVRFPAPSGEAR